MPFHKHRTAALIATMALTFATLVSGCGSGGTNVSCSPSYEYSNSYGKISAQQRGKGYGIAWGAYPNGNPSGTYTADVYINGRRFDHKSQTYPPHGSVPASAVKTGDIFRLEGTFSNSQTNQSFWLECKSA
jgi:hypothetical protein